MGREVECMWDDVRIDQSEAYKVLRTNIEFSQVEGKLTTFTLTSCLPGEGKSTTAYNLALSMVEGGLRVLLVDADLRKPLLVKTSKIKNLKGLTNYIMNKVGLEDIVNETSVPGLFFVSCGVKPPNPAELLGSSRFGEFLAEMSQKYDAVLIDTPPLGSVIDAAIVAARTDAVILVLQPKKVDYKFAQNLKEQLVKANANLLGLVLNRVDRKECRKRYHYYDYHYNRRSEHGEWIRSRKLSKRSDDDD